MKAFALAIASSFSPSAGVCATLARRRRQAVVLAALGLATPAGAQLVNSEWNTGNGSWNVAGSWSPADVPDNGGSFTYDVQIGNRPVAAGAQVTFIPEDGTEDTISNLTVSGGADLLTNGRQLNVLTQLTLDGTGSTIRVDQHSSNGTASLTTSQLDLNNGSGLNMAGGIAAISGQMEINVGSVLFGSGTINVGDGDAVVEQAFENSGLIQLQGSTGAPQSLILHANGVDTIDLDGDSEAGTVDLDNTAANVNADTLTLVIDGPLTDPIGGGPTQILIGQRDTITFKNDFTIAGAVGTPAVISLAGGNATATLDGAGAITSIANSAWTVTGAALVANDMTFTGTGNTVTIEANSTLELDGTVTIPDASALNLNGLTAGLIIGGTTTINEAAGDFNWDGNGAGPTTVKGTGLLSLTVNRVDTTDDVYGGTLTLMDDGDVAVQNTANLWTLGGTVRKRNAGTSTISGDSVNVTGVVDVEAGTLILPTGSTLAAGSNVTVDGTLTMNTSAALAGPAVLSGSGTFRLAGSSTVTANTTVGTTSFDWDGSAAGSLHTIADGVTFTINATTWDADDAGDMDDPINLGGNSAILAVNNVPSWTMNRTLTTNTAAAGIASLNGNSRMILNGAQGLWNANGQTAVNAPVTFGTGSTANIAAGGFIRLNGGDNVSNFNRIEGGTVNGPGALMALNNRELRGFGTINAPITFQSTSSLRADDGTLTIGGTINQVSTIGTADADGILSVTNAWNSNVAANVLLNGGEIQGGQITVANTGGIKGRGLVGARVINNTRLEANVLGETLVFQAAANDNDWDGSANTGVLAATVGGILEVRDNATFTFGGAVTATGGGRVYAKGFGLTCGPGSSVNLTGSTLQADTSTTFNGAINVPPGGLSTLNVQLNHFLTIGATSVLTLDDDLQLITNNGAIQAGAKFIGNGALVVPAGSHIITEPNANIETLLVLDGTLRPSGFNTVGREDLKDFQMGPTGVVESEIEGTALNQFDRLVVNGSAVVNGLLRLDIDGGFIPVAGQSFNVIAASGGVTGKFNAIESSGMPAGLAFKINYLANAVQVQVIAGTDYDQWMSLFPTLTGAQKEKTADPDGDGLNNLGEYALDGDPSVSGNAKIFMKIAPVGGIDALTLTFPVRNGPFPFAGDPAGGELILLGLTTPDLQYVIQATDTFVSYPLDVTRVLDPDAAAIQAGLPALHNNYQYVTCRSPGPVAGDPTEFMRLRISQ